jgi:Asp-tRNA(Asn)/Glu-tRNA(Gln) amidotransferase A subunit family amidase
LQTAYPTNSILELNPTVLADADAKDAERAACAPNCGFNKLHGIPVLLKDNVCADGMECTAGDTSRTLSYSLPFKFGSFFNNLHGIPVLLKDNVCAAGMQCTAGDTSRTLHEPVSQDYLLIVLLCTFHGVPSRRLKSGRVWPKFDKLPVVAMLLKEV